MRAFAVRSGFVHSHADTKAQTGSRSRRMGGPGLLITSVPRMGLAP